MYLYWWWIVWFNLVILIFVMNMWYCVSVWFCWNKRFCCFCNVFWICCCVLVVNLNLWICIVSDLLVCVMWCWFWLKIISRWFYFCRLLIWLLSSWIRCLSVMKILSGGNCCCNGWMSWLMLWLWWLMMWIVILCMFKYVICLVCWYLFLRIE